MKNILSLGALVTLLSSCGEQAPEQHPEQTARPAESTAEDIPVPSDPKATYSLLEWSLLPNGNRMAITGHEGPSGTSFSRREIDCRAMQFRYLGEGDTLEEAKIDRPSDRMGDLVPGSISTEVSTFVCAK